MAMRLLFATACLCLPQLTPAPPASTCEDTYKIAFKRKKNIKPSQVGELYFEYCKKNMQVGSVKSLDELCQPMKQKAAEKMSWVPDDVVVTPALACKKIDQLKKDYPEHAKKQESADGQLKKQEDAWKQTLTKKANLVNTNIASDMNAAMDKEGAALKAAISDLVRKQVMSGLEKEGEPVGREKVLIDSLNEYVQLQLKGIATKFNQKKEEALGTWVSGEATDIREAKKKEAKEGKKGKDEM